MSCNTSPAWIQFPEDGYETITMTKKFDGWWAKRLAHNSVRSLGT
jgi:hypothetical protein